MADPLTTIGLQNEEKLPPWVKQELVQLVAGMQSGFQNAAALVPVGTVIAKASTSVPTGYLLCDGSPVSREDYAALFAEIGTTFGVGNGSGTFNLPDLRGRTIVGAGAGSGLTSRTHGAQVGSEKVGLNPNIFVRATGAGSAGKCNWDADGVNDHITTEIFTDGSGTAGDSTLQPSLVLSYFIKY